MLRKKLAEKGIGSTSDFRWRSHEITRVEGFSDAVFAFAVTLLVVSLEVPKTFGELLSTMQGFIAFACGFALLFFIWFNQYEFFRRYGLHDGFTITVNGALLFVVLFFVYPLKFLFTFLVKAFSSQETEVRLSTGIIEPIIRTDQTGILMIIYGLGYVAVFGIFAVLYLHAERKRDQLELNELELFDTRTSVRENLLQASVGVLSISIAAVGGSKYAFWSGITYVIVGPVMALHGAFSGRQRRKLENQTA
jgi:uncharacterized membrane protein